MDGASRTDAASGRRRGSWMPPNRAALTFSGITSSEAANGRAGRVSGNFEDTIRAKTRRTQRAEPGGHHRRSEPDPARAGLDTSSTATRRTFATLDGWVRMRLRSILRHRQGGQGRGRGADHQRWPNAFFAEHGLFSLATPMLRPVSPLGGKTTNWRAGCGRSACPVRREGEPNSIGSPYPYRANQDITGISASLDRIRGHGI